MYTFRESSVLESQFLRPYQIILTMFRYTCINLFGKQIWTRKGWKHMFLVVYSSYLIMMWMHATKVLEDLNQGADLVHLAHNLSGTVLMIQVLLLYPHIYFSRNKINSVISKILNGWREYEHSTEEFEDIRKKEMKLINRICFLYVNMAKVYLHFYMIIPWIITFVKKYILQIDTSYMMAFSLQMPFEFDQNFALYTLAWFMDYTVVMNICYLQNSDLLLMAVTMSHLQTLFLMLQKDLTLVFNQCLKKQETKEAVQQTEMILKDSIRRHIRYLSIVEELSSAFGGIFAINLTFLSFSICFFGFAARVTWSFNSLNNLLASVMRSIYLFFCCFYGQRVLDSSAGLSDAVYHSNWYTYPQMIKKTLILIMIRSQKPTYIKSTTFFKVSLTTFTTVMKTTWSMLSLVTTLYVDTGKYE